MADSSLGAVAELLKLFTGKGNSTTTKESTGGFTETTQKGLPPEAMQALIKTAMEGNQGLAGSNHWAGRNPWGAQRSH